MQGKTCLSRGEGGVKKHQLWVKLISGGRLSTLATDTAGQLDILGHDGHTLGVNGCQVGVLEQADQVGLAGLLERQHRRALEPQVCNMGAIGVEKA